MSTAPSRRIAIVTQGFQTAGGIQTSARWLAAGLRGAGHTVVVFDLASSRSDAHSRRISSPATWLRRPVLQVDHDEQQVVHVGANGVELEPLRYLPRRELTRQLDRFDLVHVVAGGPALALVAARCTVPVVVQFATRVAEERSAQLSSTSGPAHQWRSAMTTMTSRLERRALRSVDVVLVMNRHMARFVTEVCTTPVVMAPPGVDTDRFTPRVEGWSADGHMLSVCRLNDARKGLDRLVRAYAHLRDTAPGSPRLVLAGRTHPPVALTALIDELGLHEDVQIRPDLPSEELTSLLRQSSVYVQASYEEGFGISVTEAMASGLPVVATDTAGTRETVVPGETGWLVSQTADVATEMAARIDQVRTAAGPRMAVLARERAVSTFSDRASLDRVLAVHGDLVAAPKGSS